MSDAYETFEVNGYTVNIYQDTEQGSGDPRDADNLGVMLANGHRHYVLGDAEHKSHIPEYDEAARIVEEHVEQGGRPVDGNVLIAAFKERLGATVVLPLWLLDHSGLAMQTGPFVMDPGQWDSGVVGFIFDTPRTREMHGTPLDKIEEVLTCEVEDYDKYLQGDVWGYVIENPYASEVGSCWAILGIENAREEATSEASALDPPLVESDLSDVEREALGELVHEAASQIAFNVIDEGKGLEYLVTNGWSLDDVRGRLNEMTAPSEHRLVPSEILGVDDWLVIGVTDTGVTVFMIAETLPAWLDAPHGGQAEYGTAEHAEDWRYVLAHIWSLRAHHIWQRFVHPDTGVPTPAEDLRGRLKTYGAELATQGNEAQ